MCTEDIDGSENVQILINVIVMLSVDVRIVVTNYGETVFILGSF
jgi:hypothetical protein